MADLDTHNIKQLKKKGQAVRQIILEATFPADLEKEIAFYAELGKN